MLEPEHATPVRACRVRRRSSLFDITAASDTDATK
jgi:hypothetical protein